MRHPVAALKKIKFWQMKAEIHFFCGLGNNLAISGLLSPLVAPKVG